MAVQNKYNIHNFKHNCFVFVHLLQFYGCLSQQQNMLQDFLRTATYQKAILLNDIDFKDKVCWLAKLFWSMWHFMNCFCSFHCLSLYRWCWMLAVEQGFCPFLPFRLELGKCMQWRPVLWPNMQKYLCWVHQLLYLSPWFHFTSTERLNVAFNDVSFLTILQYLRVLKKKKIAKNLSAYNEIFCQTGSFYAQ